MTFRELTPLHVTHTIAGNVEVWPDRAPHPLMIRNMNWLLPMSRLQAQELARALLDAIKMLEPEPPTSTYASISMGADTVAEWGGFKWIQRSI